MRRTQGRATGTPATWLARTHRRQFWPTRSAALRAIVDWINGFSHRRRRRAAAMGDGTGPDRDMAALLRRIATRSDLAGASAQLVQHGARAVRPVVAAIAGPAPRGWDARDWGDTLRPILSQIGSVGTPALIALLGSANESVRMTAAWSLGPLRDPRAIEPLLAALDDPSRWVRWSAVEALQSVHDDRLVEPLTRRLADQDSLVRGAALRALSSYADVRSLSAVEELAWTEQLPGIRLQAVALAATLRRRLA